MATISFWAPVKSDSCSPFNLTEELFAFGGHEFTKIDTSGECLRTPRENSCMGIALKVVLLITVVIPLIALIVKAIHRAITTAIFSDRQTASNSVTLRSPEDVTYISGETRYISCLSSHFNKIAESGTLHNNIIAIRFTDEGKEACFAPNPRINWIPIVKNYPHLLPALKGSGVMQELTSVDQFTELTAISQHITSIYCSKELSEELSVEENSIEFLKFVDTLPKLELISGDDSFFKTGLETVVTQLLDPENRFSLETFKKTFGLLTNISNIDMFWVENVPYVHRIYFNWKAEGLKHVFENGGDLLKNTADQEGMTLLHLAKNRQMAQQLIALGLDPERLNKKGKKPYETAKTQKARAAIREALTQPVATQ